MTEQMQRFYIRTAAELNLTDDRLLKFFVYEQSEVGSVLIGAFPSEQVEWRVIDALVLAYERELQEQWHKHLPGDNHADR